MDHLRVKDKGLMTEAKGVPDPLRSGVSILLFDILHL
jgi:hypothetical protein